jgi:hypothetical protein
VGFEVSPVIENSWMYRWSVPLVTRPRVVLSSQRLWPIWCSFWVDLSFPSWAELCSAGVGGLADCGQGRLKRGGKFILRITSRVWGCANTRLR